MSDVMHQNGSLNGFGLSVKDKDTFLLERDDSLTHQMKSTK